MLRQWRMWSLLIDRTHKSAKDAGSARGFFKHDGLSDQMLGGRAICYCGAMSRFAKRSEILVPNNEALPLDFDNDTGLLPGLNDHEFIREFGYAI